MSPAHADTSFYWILALVSLLAAGSVLQLQQDTRAVAFGGLLFGIALAIFTHEMQVEGARERLEQARSEGLQTLAMAASQTTSVLPTLQQLCERADGHEQQALQHVYRQLGAHFSLLEKMTGQHLSTDLHDLLLRMQEQFARVSGHTLAAARAAFLVAFPQLRDGVDGCPD